MRNLNADLIGKTLAAPRGMYRRLNTKPGSKPMVRASIMAGGLSNSQPDEEEVTLHETPNPKSDVLYDLFETFGTVHGGTKPVVSCCVKLSFARPTELRSVDVCLVDKDSNDIIASTELPIQASNAASHTITGSIDVKGVDIAKLENAILVAGAAWQKPYTDETIVCKEVPIKPLALGMEYTHIYPKKETETVCLGKEADEELKNEVRDNVYPPADPNTIVVALWRTPETGHDADYVCFFGRVDNNNAKPPYFGVPAKGRIAIGGIKIVSFSAKGYVEPCDKDGNPIGGVMTLSHQKKHDIGEGDVEYSIVGGILEYNLLNAWYGGKDTFEGDAGFKKHYYKFNLAITLIDSDDNTYYGIIAHDISESEKAYCAFTQKVALIAVMFGCLAEGTLVKMADGREIPIENVHTGDKVWNPAINAPAEVVNKWTGVEDTPLLKITTQVGTISMTRDHPVFTPRNGIVRAGKLSIGDSIHTGFGIDSEVKITNIEQGENTTVNVYNLDLDGDIRSQCFLANKIAVGTNHLQNTAL